MAILLLAVGALAAGALLGARSVYFLGIDEGGRVALYRGLPYELPLDTVLYEERYSSPLRADALPERFARAVSSHEWRSRADAADLLREIEVSRGVR
jgi:protein phosphatase